MAEGRDWTEELRGALAQAQALLNAAGADGEDVTRQVYDEVTESLARARAVLADLEEDASLFTRENPWKALGLAVVMGVTLGALVGRRR
jgi:ElaB/YqjD/DUF883 family membrane-anchored ribosome-binding protein